MEFEEISISTISKKSSEPALFNSLLAGGAAGTAVDTVLFPLDTLKTRLQSREGFFRSGGFTGIYRGLGSAVIGSAPSAAAFFTTYEFLKRKIRHHLPEGKKYDGITHMIASSCGEISACTVRVPTEVIKQRLQTNQYNSIRSAVSNIWESNGILGFYRGYRMTIFREIPFACIQFPLYEYLKVAWGNTWDRRSTPLEAAFCGSFAGGVAAAVTTPLDVVKTRIMLSSSDADKKILGMFSRVVKEEGGQALFRGIVPRVFWISIGGFIFLGMYEKTVWILNNQNK